MIYIIFRDLSWAYDFIECRGRGSLKEAAEESVPAEQLVQTDHRVSFNGFDYLHGSIALQYSFHHH